MMKIQYALADHLIDMGPGAGVHGGAGGRTRET